MLKYRKELSWRQIMSYKTTDGLMRHLRQNGISISGSKQKRQLINSGYFHGYKGYRFYNTPNNRIPFISFEEIYATIQYDNQLKTLFYPKMMFIETAIKNISIECILNIVKSENIQEFYNIAVESYRTASPNLSQENKKKIQQKKLNLQNTIQSYLSKAYKNDNSKISHFYNNMSYSGVPLWSLFEIMTLGDVGYLLSCLTFNARDSISRKIGLNLSADTNRELVYKYVYLLKDLRNAIAHNSVVFDTRFNKVGITRPMKRCLENELNLPYVNFKTIGDYIFLICYYLKILKVTRTEIKAFVREFEKITDDFINKVSSNVSSIVIHPDYSSRMSTIKNYL